VAWLAQTAVSSASPVISFLVGGTVLALVYVPLALLGDESLRRQVGALGRMVWQQIR
jgi:hypothetical protein